MPGVTDRAAGNLSDDYAELITAAGAGDKAALERLLMTAQDVAYRFSRSVCGGPADAEDVMQDALMKTFRYVRRIRDPHAFRTWLYRTVRNACLMKRRRKAGEPVRVLSIDDVLPGAEERVGAVVPAAGRSPEALAANAALRRRLGRALLALPPNYRAIVFLRDMEGLSTKDVAGVLNIGESSVKMRLHRARLFLRKQLEDR